ncbi:MAG: hypothetical protein IK137_03890 [Bacilli bacterium]|nr:hypothetical protein [Bacilli bacterium]
MGLFDKFKNNKKDKVESNKLRVIFIEDYDDYKKGQIVEVDKSYGEFLVGRGYASSNLNINVKEESKKIEEAREKRFKDASDSAYNEVMKGYVEATEEAEKLVSSLNTRLHGTSANSALEDMMREYQSQKINSQRDRGINTK